MNKILFLACLAVSSAAFAQIPNASFETWGSRNTESIDKWIIQGEAVKSNSPHSGSFALRLQDPNSGAIYTKAYSGRPDTVSFWVKGYNQANDSASLGVYLQRLGNFLGYASAMVHLTDSNNYVQVKAAVTYLFPLAKADTITMMLQTTSSGSPDTAFATVDDVEATKAGAAEGSLSNAGFETWNLLTFPILNGWITSTDIASKYFGIQSVLASQSSDALSGTSALMLENKTIAQFQSVFPGAAISVDLSRFDALTASGEDAIPSFPVNERWQYLHGHAKYIPNGTDTAKVAVFMYKAGQQIGYGEWITSATNTAYKTFSVYIGYTTADVPDSACITLTAGSENGDPQPGSKFIVDSLALGYATGIRTFSPGSVSIYPNPARHLASLEFTMYQATTATLTITDLAGSTVQPQQRLTLASGYNRTDLSTAALPAGVYLIKLEAQGQLLVKKLLID